MLYLISSGEGLFFSPSPPGRGPNLLPPLPLGEGPIFYLLSPWERAGVRGALLWATIARPQAQTDSPNGSTNKLYLRRYMNNLSRTAFQWEFLGSVI